MRRVLVTGVAGTVLLAGCSASSANSGDRDASHASAKPGVVVTCRAPSGGADQDRAVLRRRVAKIAADASVAVAGNTVRLRVPGATRAQADGLCRRGEVALRPLIAPAVRIAGGTQADPLAKLGFTVPGDEAAYSRLSVSRQQTLVHRLQAAACAPAPSANRPVVGCERGRTGRTAALLAAPVVDAGGVRAAKAVHPMPSSQGASSTEWTVEVDLTASARAAWADYTSAHNAQALAAVDSDLDPTTCAPALVPCATWVGVVADGVLLSLPVTESPITQGRVQFAGSFSAASAPSLAVALGAGALPVALDLVSVR